MRTNMITIIGIILLSALLIGMLENIFYKPNESSVNSVPPDEPIYDFISHNGGVYYNSTHSGVRYSFDDPDLVCIF